MAHAQSKPISGTSRQLCQCATAAQGQTTAKAEADLGNFHTPARAGEAYGDDEGGDIDEDAVEEGETDNGAEAPVACTCRG
ncbi:hypothetical protein RSAG8_07219, partial [Rhizoctonia solani AG-8 WAC10335]